MSTTLSQCPHCGKQIGAWGSCPECKGAITSEQDACKECGFPLRAPKQAPAPPPPVKVERGTTSRSRRRRKTGPLLEPAEEPPGTMLFAVFGLFVPVLAFVALALSRKGSRAYKLAWVGIALWIAGTLLLFSKLR